MCHWGILVRLGTISVTDLKVLLFGYCLFVLWMCQNKFRLIPPNKDRPYCVACIGYSPAAWNLQCPNNTRQWISRSGSNTIRPHQTQDLASQGWSNSHRGSYTRRKTCTLKRFCEHYTIDHGKHSKYSHIGPISALTSINCTPYLKYISDIRLTPNITNTCFDKNL